MDNNENVSSIYFQIYEISKSLYKNKTPFENNLKIQENKGYLIEKDIFDKIMREIENENLNPLMLKNGLSEKIFEIIKEKTKDIIPKKFINSNELIKELNSNKSFYILKQDIMDKIRDLKYLKGKGIIYKLSKDFIIIIFNENDKLYFYTKNKIIGEANLDEKYSLNKIESNHVQSNEIHNVIKFKEDLEILIRIFYYNKYLREKENIPFEFINLEYFNETVYLINDSWMEKYKSFFDYQNLKNYLITNKIYFDLFPQNKYNLSNEVVQNIFENLSNDYINKINEKKNFKNISFEYEIKESNLKMSYPYNNHIINSKIYELLTKYNNEKNNSIKKAELYYLGYNKILLSFQKDKQIYKDYDQIGYINESEIFIPEFLIEYLNKKNDDNTLEILNNFIKNDFFDFYLDKKTDSCKIKNSRNKIMGLCFKLNNFYNINNMTNINNKSKFLRNIEGNTKCPGLCGKNNIQNWRKELKSIDSTLLKKIILIQSIFRGKWLRKNVNDLFYLNYSYIFFCKKIKKVMLSNLSPILLINYMHHVKEKKIKFY